MIHVEGYKAFHGWLKVTPVNKVFDPIMLHGDFLYKPELDCWYGNGSSYPAGICEVFEDARV